MPRRFVTLSQRPVPDLTRSWAFAIVRACRRLTATAKLLYGLLRELDNPNERNGQAGGCYMSEDELARQLGAGIDHVSDLRTHLERLGLVHKEHPAGSAITWWFPTLPAIVETVPPREIEMLTREKKTEARRRWLTEQAEALDRYIAEREGLISSPITVGRERHRMRRNSPEVTNDSAIPKRRNPPAEDGGIRGTGVTTSGGVPDADRRNPPSTDHDRAKVELRSDSLKALGHEVEGLNESHNARTRSIDSTSMAGPLGKELELVMTRFRRRQKELQDNRPKAAS